MNNPQPQPVAPTQQKKSNTKWILLIVAVICICVLCSLVLAVLSFFGIFKSDTTVSTNTSNTVVNNTTSNSTNTTANTTSNSTTTQTATTRVFIGNYVTATIPTDWNIVEYSDKTGMAGFADDGNTTFSGLTGLDILNENNTLVFSLKGIDGIGGAGGCTSLAVFNDTDANYIQDVKDETDMLGFGSTNVVDLTNSSYSSINTLNLRFRRVGNLLYVAKGFTAGFNTACGIDAQFIKIDELNFTVKSGVDTYSANAYKFNINTLINNVSTLEQLDEVLNSLKAKSAS